MSAFATPEYQEQIRIAMLAAIAEAERDLSPEQRKKNAAERERINEAARQAADKERALGKVWAEIDARAATGDIEGAVALALAHGLDPDDITPTRDRDR